MIKVNKREQDFLNTFSKSNEWQIYKETILVPLLNDIESVNSSFLFDSELSAGEKFAGRQMASKFGRGLIRMTEMFDGNKTTTKKPQDNFE
jgi:hypothetical protein